MAQIAVTASSALPGLAAVSFVHEDTHLVAPYTIAVEAMPSNMGVVDGGDMNPAMHEMDYDWTIIKVGDPSYQTAKFSAPINLADGLNRKAKQYGKRISQTIMIEDVTPGAPSVFRFECVITNLATGKTTSIVPFTRTVQHPDDGFAAGETFVFRGDPSETNHPNTSNPLYATAQDAQSAAHAALSAATITKARICLQAGQTGTLGRGPGDTTGACFLIDSWGAAARFTVANTTWEPFRDV